MAEAETNEEFEEKVWTLEDDGIFLDEADQDWANAQVFSVRQQEEMVRSYERRRDSTWNAWGEVQQ